MGTRSLIGVVQPDRSIRYIFCFMDGYPGWQGQMLRTYFPESEDAHHLMDNGTLSHISWSGQPQRAKGPPEPAQICADVETFLSIACERTDAEWAYVLQPYGWQCARIRYISGAGSFFEPLDIVLEREAFNG